MGAHCATLCLSPGSEYVRIPRHVLAGNEAIVYGCITVDRAAQVTWYNVLEQRSIEYWAYQELESKVCEDMISEKLKGIESLRESEADWELSEVVRT